ncbi:MAG: ArgR family transcriptional regulator [Streptococcaceae bacterium]|nr:ArgR family transcriptional regulator [Streptococcaceae bacterium]
MNLKKVERHRLIKKIIAENAISTQKELLLFLHQKKLKVNQSTLSRDVRELGLLKMHNDDGILQYFLPHFLDVSEDMLRQVVRNSMQSLECVQFMLVMRTKIGDANVIAGFIDELYDTEIAGTLAGANTLVIIMRDAKKAEELKLTIESWLE